MARKIKTVRPFGETFDIYKSTRKNKQFVAISRKRKLIVHFGDPNMREYPGTKRGNSYCTRSQGVGPTRDVTSANFWSRWYLWNCKGKVSMKRRPTP